MKGLVIASSNPGKIREFEQMLSPLGFEIVAQSQLGVVDAEEPHATFVENALAKARHASRASGGAAIADDSGLCVDALGGAPGVASAHFAPVRRRVEDREGHRRVQDAANNALLLDRLRGVDDRRARFVSTLVAVRSDADPEPLIAVGRWPGVVLDAPRGDRGFGYDPLVLVPDLGKTVAELDARLKNQVSHRARAAERMLALLRDEWRLDVAAAGHPLAS
jgi:XTP/dITP diphosphohydrolase